MKTKTKKSTSATTPRSPLANKTKTTALTLTPILSLPDDLLMCRLARVSRLYYPTLSLVSKRFQSLLDSPELYKARSLLGRTESCLYVCFACHPQDRWFTLCRKPDQTLTSDTNKNDIKKKSSRYVLAQVPSPHSYFAGFSGLYAVGSKIYNIAEYGSISRCFSVLDCTSHKWSKAPSLPVKLNSFSSSVIDRKIYLAGCYKDSISDSVNNTIQVFDTETQIWDPEPIPCSLKNGDRYRKIACIDGKLHVKTLFREEVFAYNVKEGKWDVVEQGRNGVMMTLHYVSSNSCCEVENVLYSVSWGTLIWYDTKVSKWRKLEGLVGLPKFPDGACIRLANYGGKIAVFWDERAPYYGLCDAYAKKFWCAEIALERPRSCEIWGKVEWFDHVLTDSYEMVKVLAATV